MPVMPYSKLRQNLAEAMDDVCDSRAPLIVTRQKARPVVMLSLEEYEALQETRHLLGSARNAARLRRSIAHAKAGRLTRHGPRG